jgi:hypothetical protein
MIDIGFWEFLVILLLVFALAVLIAGLFTAYFGAGKSRKIGVVLIVVGLIVGLMFTIVPIREATGIPPDGTDVSTIVINAALVLIAAAIGAVIALVLFLAAIMKS